MTDSDVVIPDRLIESSQGQLYRDLEEGTTWPPNKDHGFRRALLMMRLNPTRKAILVDRYINLVKSYTNKVSYISKLYYMYHSIIQFGSVLVPALLTIQKALPDSTIIFWLGWSFSVLVGVVTGVSTVTNVDKKFFTWRKVEKGLKSEGWEYFALTGRYQSMTHEMAFPLFCHTIETIQKRSEEDMQEKKQENVETKPDQKD